MDIPITTPALLFPAIAILMLGFVNRYQGTANLIRMIKKDYDTGYKRTSIVNQLHILTTRIELSRYMLMIGSMALMLACLSMFLIFIEQQNLGNSAFGLSIAAMIASILISLYETSLSNKSLMIEIDDIFKKEKHK